LSVSYDFKSQTKRKLRTKNDQNRKIVSTFAILRTKSFSIIFILAVGLFKGFVSLRTQMSSDDSFQVLLHVGPDFLGFSAVEFR